MDPFKKNDNERSLLAASTCSLLEVPIYMTVVIRPYLVVLYWKFTIPLGTNPMRYLSKDSLLVGRDWLKLGPLPNMSVAGS